MTNKCFLSLTAGIARYFKSKINRTPICLTRGRKYEACFSNFFSLRRQGFSTNLLLVVSVIAEARFLRWAPRWPTGGEQEAPAATQCPEDLCFFKESWPGNQPAESSLSLALGGVHPKTLGYLSFISLCIETGKITCGQRAPSCESVSVR